MHLNYISELNSLCCQQQSPGSLFTASFLLFLCTLGNGHEKRFRKQSVSSCSLDLVTRGSWGGEESRVPCHICVPLPKLLIRSWPPPSSLPLVELPSARYIQAWLHFQSTVHILIQTFIVGLQSHSYLATPPQSHQHPEARSNPHLLHPQCLAQCPEQGINTSQAH